MLDARLRVADRFGQLRGGRVLFGKLDLARLRHTLKRLLRASGRDVDDLTLQPAADVKRITAGAAGYDPGAVHSRLPFHWQQREPQSAIAKRDLDIQRVHWTCDRRTCAIGYGDIDRVSGSGERRFVAPPDAELY